MKNQIFKFKQFDVIHNKSVMKVGTDGVLVGALADCSKSSYVLDVGTGTGLIALMIAQRSKSIIDAIDISDEAIEIANVNVQNSNWGDRIFIKKSSLQEYQANYKYDLIVSNPPFYSTDIIAPEKNRAIARHTINLTTQDLVSFSLKLLSDIGIIAVIYPVEVANAFIDKCIESGLYLKRKVIISSRFETAPIRVFAELSKQKCDSEIVSVSIEKNTRHDFSNEYISITKDYYLNFP